MTPRREEEHEEDSFEDFDEEPLSSWAAIRRFLRGLARQVKRLSTDVYEGKDANNPSVTMRLDRIERSLGLLSKVLWVTTAAAAAAVFGTIGQIAVMVLKAH